MKHERVFTCPETEDLNGVCLVCGHGIERHGPDYECYEKPITQKKERVSMEKATGRPWKVKEGSKIVAGKNQTVICDTYGYIDEYAFQPHRDANAALIVRAVNSYDALVDLVEDLREYFADCADASAEGDPLEFKPNKEMTILESIESALKLAKGA